MIIQAGAVVTMDGSPIKSGAVQIEGNEIVWVGPSHEASIAKFDEVISLPGYVLLPGLINAHCHLDYTAMRGAILQQSSFTAWVQRINAVKRSLDSDDYLY